MCGCLDNLESVFTLVEPDLAVSDSVYPARGLRNSAKGENMRTLYARIGIRGLMARESDNHVVRRLRLQQIGGCSRSILKHACGCADAADHRESRQLFERSRAGQTDMDRQIDSGLGGLVLPIDKRPGIEAKLGNETDLERSRLRELDFPRQRSRNTLGSNGFAPFRVRRNADFGETVFPKRPVCRTSRLLSKAL
jgi:hypothetical protein